MLGVRSANIAKEWAIFFAAPGLDWLPPCAGFELGSADA